jgi:hypothetical protein
MRDTENMSNNNDESQAKNHKKELAPIENTNDLLGEALKRMSPQKQEEIVAKATDEALRLQVKHKEGQLDHDMASNKLESAVDAARQLGSANAEFSYESEHRSEHGRVNVKVQSKAPPPPTLSQRVGGCFVATAAYGDFNHPCVIELRKFRDNRLRHHTLGRAFIKSYYKFGPELAKKIENKPLMQSLTILLLAPITVLATLFNKTRTR